MATTTKQKPLTMKGLADRMDIIESKIDALAVQGNGGQLDNLLSAVALAVSTAVSETMAKKIADLRGELTEAERNSLKEVRAKNEQAQRELEEVKKQIENTIIGLGF